MGDNMLNISLHAEKVFCAIPCKYMCKKSCKSLLRKMAKTKKTLYRKVQLDDGVRPETSGDTAEGEGAKKLKKRVSIHTGFHF